MHLENDQLDDSRGRPGVYRCVLCGEIFTGLKAEAETGQFVAKLTTPLFFNNVIYRLLYTHNKFKSDI